MIQEKLLSFICIAGGGLNGFPSQHHLNHPEDAVQEAIILYLPLLVTK